MICGDNRTDFIIKIADIKKNESILTVGVAHIPEIEKIIENRVKTCVCIDLDKTKLRQASKYTHKTIFIYGDITKPPKDFLKKFDTIIMLEVLEHIEEDLQTLKILHSLLKKGGKLVISVPNKHLLHLLNPLRYTQHKRHYSLGEITSKLKKTRFAIKYTNTVESPKLLFDLYAHLFFKYIYLVN